ncbi:MAG: hypothetical protein KC470_05755, partial [Dehalococcoidia bacterium]|nr:hypothetical protein [Dehalococcoidia bacterium]
MRAERSAPGSVSHRYLVITQYASPGFSFFSELTYHGSPGPYRSHSPVTAFHRNTISMLFAMGARAVSGSPSAPGHPTRFEEPGTSGSEPAGVVAVGVAGLVDVLVGVGELVTVGVAVLPLPEGVRVGVAVGGVG